jgi:arylsulfatase A-like enzyme
MFRMPLSRRELLGASLAPLALAAEGRPNIVFIMADDLGYADLSCYGRRDYTTPNIDGIAKSGVRFTQAYANSAVCSPTRVALITGRYQYRLPIGLEEPLPSNSKRTVGLPPEHPTLQSLLRNAGYATALVGKWHLGFLPDYSPLRSGYDRFWGFRAGGIDYYRHGQDLWDGDTNIEQAGYMTDLIGDRAVSTVEEYARAKRTFLVSLHFSAPHWPWEAPGDEAESQRIRNLQHYDGGSAKTYARMVGRMDYQVGRVLRALEKTGIAKNTIVVFTSDNGGERFSDTWPFTGKKSDLLEGGLRVPALVRWPGQIRAGSVTNQVAISMDWMPTLLAAAGARPDPSFPPDGIDLLPAIPSPVARKLFWRFRDRAQAAVRDGDLKWLKIGDNAFLFNVAADPLERANLKEREPEVFRRLAADYDGWNATMLPDDPSAYTYGFGASQLADHYANPRK